MYVCNFYLSIWPERNQIPRPFIDLLHQCWMICADGINEWRRNPKYSEVICTKAALSTTDPTLLDTGHRVGTRRRTAWAAAYIYVCMYVCACMYVCTNTRMHVRNCVCFIYICIYVFVRRYILNERISVVFHIQQFIHQSPGAGESEYYHFQTRAERECVGDSIGEVMVHALGALSRTFSRETIFLSSILSFNAIFTPVIFLTCLSGMDCLRCLWDCFHFSMLSTTVGSITVFLVLVRWNHTGTGTRVAHMKTKKKKRKSG
jgi:hypothetical protein